MNRYEDAERLAEELKRLVGWGAHPKRLPLLPVLRAYAGVPEDTPYTTAGHIIRRYLIHNIGSLDGQYEFSGSLIPAEKMKRAYKLLLQIEGSGLSVVNRRYRAIQVLGHYFTIDQWRRPYGPERAFLLILAEHMSGAAEAVA